MPHCLLHAVPWSLDMCTTQRSPVHGVGMHGISNRDTQWYLPHYNSSVHLTTTSEVHLCGSPVEYGVVGEHYETRTFILDTGTHSPGMTLARTDWVLLNRLRNVRTFPLLLAQMGYGAEPLPESLY